MREAALFLHTQPTTGCGVRSTGCLNCRADHSVLKYLHTRYGLSLICSQPAVCAALVPNPEHYPPPVCRGYAGCSSKIANICPLYASNALLIIHKIYDPDSRKRYVTRPLKSPTRPAISAIIELLVFRTEQQFPQADLLEFDHSTFGTLAVTGDSSVDNCGRLSEHSWHLGAL